MSSPTPPPPIAHFLAPHRRVPRAGSSLLNGLDRLDALFDKLAGSRFNPLYQTGPLVVVTLFVLAVTGVVLFIFYDVAAPYAAMERIQGQLFFCRWIRALHRYAADAAVLFTLAHAVRLFLQGRTWGARALAWVSGVAMLALLLACGWTGFILVWDVFGHQVALEGARLVDLLPFFPEPIQTQFVSARTLGSMFFFVNLFAHVALPLAMVFAIWIHVFRVARATLFPPRALTLAVVGGMVLLSWVWPVALDGEAQLDREPTRFLIDWLYGFWLPLASSERPWGAALILVGAGVAAAAAPWWWRPSRAARPQVSTVNERHCQGCTHCALDCPYGAIQMIPRTLGTGSAEVARVTPDLCVSCGICAGSCDIFRVGPPGRTGRDQLVSIKGLLEEKQPSGDDLVIFCCTQSALRLRAVEALAGATVVPVECAGHLHAVTVAASLKRGARGAVVWSCPPRNCQFREGPKWLHARVDGKRTAALPKGVDRARVLVLDAGPGELDVALREIEAFRARLAGKEVALVAPSRARVVGGRLGAASVLLVGLGLLSTTSVTRTPSAATLRLAWRHDAGLLERCRVPSEAEQAALPPHMRRPRICERRHPDLHVVVRVDGDTVIDRVVAAGGARKDRAPQLLMDAPVAAGRHAVSVHVAPVLTAAEAEETGRVPMVIERTIDAEAGHIWRVEWDRATGGLALIPPAPSRAGGASSAQR